MTRGDRDGPQPLDAKIDPPFTDARPTQRWVHGTLLEDEFAWLRADDWREVLRAPEKLPSEIRAVLDRENTYAAEHLGPLGDQVATLVSEMRGRLKEDDSTVPLEKDGWSYYRRYRTGGQQPIFCRRREEDGPEDVLLDGDAAAEGHAFFQIAELVPSPDHQMIAWSVDAVGSELYEIRLRQAGASEDVGERIGNTDGSIVWMKDGLGFYYVQVDENHRTCKVWQHTIGRPLDVLIFEENDPAWFVRLSQTISGVFAIISVSDHDASECHLVPLDDPAAGPRCIAPREPHLKYTVAHRGDGLYLLTNADGAEDYKIVTAPAQSPDRANWTDLVPHRYGCFVLGMAIFPDYLVRLEREEGLPRIVVRSLADGHEYSVAFPEAAYSLDLDRRLAFDTEVLRFTYSSMTTPRETFDFNLRSGERALRKRQIIPSGHDPAAYVTRRIFARAPDGAEIPVTLLHKAGLAIDGQAPVLLYGYGAYGHAIPASFNSNALSLVDRGFIYAIAHIRGGTDKGWHWYLDGKLEKKANTFSDFIAVADELIADGYTSRGGIVAQGGSAGGMLMGAVANLAPRLFAGIIAAVPFVDVLNTILDADLPLTPPEWLEWGNPILDPRAFDTIRAYSPYDNVAAQTYPPMLVLAGLTDPRVTYWEPAKWVARLRRKMTEGGPILLKTNMGAGHGGASGRFDRLTEIAESYAFALACAERRPAGVSSR